MGIVREPEGVDFIIAGGPMKPENAALVTEWLQANRAVRTARIEAEVLALPTLERAKLLHRLVDSLTPAASAESTPPVASKSRTASGDGAKNKWRRVSKARVSS